jgi:hypothetical protein
MKKELPIGLRHSAMSGAQHEMGHYLVARALGFRTGEVSIKFTTPNDLHGSTTVELGENLASLDDVTKYLERRILVLLAGAAAETLPPDTIEKFVDHEAVLEIHRKSSRGTEQDFAQAKELITILRNISHFPSDPAKAATLQAEHDRLEEKLMGRAAELVENYGELIVALAWTLTGNVTTAYGRATLKAEELERIPSVRAISVVKPF